MIFNKNKFSKPLETRVVKGGVPYASHASQQFIHTFRGDY